MSRPPPTARWPAWLTVLALGAAALVTQTILFRRFLSVFEGNELGIGAFFATWLLWVGTGAVLGRVAADRSRFLVGHFAWLPLLYLPAFLLQSWLLANARSFAGVASYELFAFARMLPAALLANAPVSLLTGCLFTLSCRWLATVHPLAVAATYIREAVGAAVGGVAVTVLLGAGVAEPTVLLLLGAALAATATAHRDLGRRRLAPAALAILLLALALGGAGAAWQRHDDRRAWERLLPGERCLGGFTTPQARYLYGRRHGQFNVMAWGEVVESLPADDQAAAVLALHLAQHPSARRFLVVGAGSLGLCRQLLQLPQTTQVVWLTLDPAYAAGLLAALPAELRVTDARFAVPGADVRRCLETDPTTYDLIVLNLPDATTLALNRCHTAEFYRLAAARLATGGVLGVRVAGGENHLGPELVAVGASVRATLLTVFPHLAVKPGDETWLLASFANRLTATPDELRQRFEAVPGGAALYPPAGLLDLYRPDRADFQLARYRAAAERGADALVNTDARPRGLWQALLFVGRQAGLAGGLAAALPRLAHCGLWLVLLPLLVYVGLRLTWRARFPEPRPSPPASARAPLPVADTHVLVFATGAAGMALSLVLLFLYQARFGSLFLHVGLLSAVFMLGLALGGVAAANAAQRAGPLARRLLPAALLAHLAVVLLLACLPAAAPAWALAGLFLVAGGVGGLYLPAAAARLKAAGIPDATAGSLLELGDHAGGAAGGLAAGLLLLPLFGVNFTLTAVALLLGVNLAAFLPATTLGWLFRYRHGDDDERPDPWDARLAWLGALLLAGGLLLLAGAYAWRAAPAPPPPDAAAGGAALLPVARELVPDATFVPARLERAGAAPVDYLRWQTADGGAGYVFSTERLAPAVTGYGGPLALTVAVDARGRLRRFRVTRHNETTWYLHLTDDWQRSLDGQPLFGPDALHDADVVSGATVSAHAIRDALRQAGNAFAAALRPDQAAPAAAGAWPAGASRLVPDRSTLCLLALLGAALLARRSRSPWPRLAVLAASVALAGAWLNVQYSTFHVFSLLTPHWPAPAATVAFALIVGVPALVLLCGNVYCGYLCPFGALQELVGRLRPGRWVTAPARHVARWPRLLKYVILFVLVAVFASRLGSGTEMDLAAGDPLVLAFADGWRLPLLLALGALLALAFVYPRFWCRYLCPSGAFLALLNGVQALRFLAPRIRHRHCAYALRADADLDCLCCDRCRQTHGADARQLRQTDPHTRPWRDGTFLALTGVIAAVCLGLALAPPLQRQPPARTAPAAPGTPTPAAAAPQPPTADTGRTGRKVDLDKLRRKLKAGELSDHEAQYYAPATPPAPPAPANP